jgi:PKD repeat protein
MKHSRLGIFAVVATCLLVARFAPTAEAALSILKGPYLQTVTSSGIYVMWQTDSASDSRVTYTPSGGSPSTVSSATTVTLHTVRLTGLSPDTTYTYQVSSSGSAGSVTGPQGSFRTAPTGAVPFRFDVYGDSRTFPADHAKVVAGMVASAPLFVLHTGDICMDSTVESQWAPEFFTPAAPAMRIAPYYPCLGNHEHESPLYFQYFAPLPQGGGTGGVEWYSFDYGSAHFAIVDTNVTFAPGSAQYNWLVNDLRNTTAEWRFVMHHHPAYSSGPDGPSPAVQSYLVPLYEQYKVDVVFSGHDHLYERSYKNGVTYVVSGGGGADLYTSGAHANPYQVFVKSVHQFASVDINGTTAVVAGRDANNVVFDSVTLNHKPTAPVANFTGAPTTGAAPLAVAFHDASTGTPTSWSWSFGDGATSTLQNPSHTYAAAGSYTVSLTASNTSGANTATKAGYISVTAPPPPAPVASFSATPTSGVAPLSVQFTDTSTNSPTAWSWTFGDGGTSTAKSPAHTYSAVGTYTVSLTATNAGGSNTMTKASYIAVSSLPPPAPVAAFSGTPTGGTAPLAVQFTDTSTNSPTSWSWSFGDGGTSTAKSPSHTYSAAGTYTVSLTATNAGGSNTATKSGYISVTAAPPAAPVANFSAAPTSGVAPLSVQFTDTSTNTPTSWSWSFGDGGTSTAKSPSHTYSAAGTYTVSLTATNAGGSNTATKSGYITVTSSASHALTVTVAATPTTVASGGSTALQATVVDTQPHSGFAYAWSDGGAGGTFSSTTAQNPTYAAPANTSGANRALTLTLTATCRWVAPWVTGTGSATITVQSASPSPPVASFSGTPTSGQAPLTVQFTDTSTNAPTSWSWNFGDGTTSTVHNPSHSYASAGTYTVSLTATNAGGSNTATKTGYITVTAPPPSAPVAAFSATPTSGTAPLTVQFTDTSTNAPTSWSWSFGDGGTSTAKSPSHTYSAAGTYTVSLTATNAGGSDTMTKAGYITVTAPSGEVTAEFSALPTRGSVPLSVRFTDASTGSPTSWLWDFGDQTSATSANPAHTYTSPGRRTVTLTVTAGGASNTMTKKGYIRIGPKDVSSASWAFDPIVTVWDAGLVKGYPGDLYRPGLEVTRDQMAVYLARAIAGDDDAVPAGPAVATFPDVGTDHWAYRYIEYLNAVGVAMGYPDGSYNPSEPVTRDQMAVYVARTIAVPLGEVGLMTYAAPLEPSFSDVLQDHWAYRYIEYVRERGVVQGYPDGGYHPKDVVTRDQMAVYVQRALQLPL